MIRQLMAGFTAVAIASAAMAQPPEPFRWQPAVVPAGGWRADNPLVLLGQKLFFDTRLSGSGRTACASCHNPDYAYAQPRRVATSDNGQAGRRNVPSVLDAAGLPALMWDGRFRSLEEQVLGPFQSGEMGINYGEAVQRLNTDAEYLHLFQVALGSRPMIGGMAHAIATFERTLVSPLSRVDRFLMNNDRAILTAQEQHGFDVFSRRAPCGSCHQPFPQHQGAVGSRPLFTDFQYHNIGVGFGSGPGGFADPGRYEHSKNSGEWGMFRTPSLRNVARTAPYMHDGSFATLEEVVEFYNAGARPNPGLSPLLKPLGLAPHEKAALVAFLRAMSDPAR